jgi:hypothetical protein
MHSQHEKDNPQLFEKMCQVRRGGHPSIDFYSILLIIAKDNNIFELQNLLKHNDFTNKLATKIKQILIYVLKIIIE